MTRHEAWKRRCNNAGGLRIVRDQTRSWRLGTIINVMVLLTNLQRAENQASSKTERTLHSSDVIGQQRILGRNGPKGRLPCYLLFLALTRLLVSTVIGIQQVRPSASAICTRTTTRYSLPLALYLVFSFSLPFCGSSLQFIACARRRR
jgi:hypothetical protein